MRESIRNLEEETFISALQDYVAIHAYLKKHQAQAETEGPFSFINDRIDPCPTAQWNENSYRAPASHSVAAFLVSAALRQSPTEFFETAAGLRLAIGGDRSKVEVFQFLEKSTQVEVGADSTFVASALMLCDQETSITPNSLFLASCSIALWLLNSPFSPVLSPGLSDVVAERWIRAIDLQRASLRQPRVTVDSIRQALADSTRGVRKIARLVLSAEPAVDYTLPADRKETLRSTLHE